MTLPTSLWQSLYHHKNNTWVLLNTLLPSSFYAKTCAAVLREVSKASARWHHCNYHGGGNDAAQRLTKHTKITTSLPVVKAHSLHRCGIRDVYLCFFPSTRYWCILFICTTSSNPPPLLSETQMCKGGVAKRVPPPPLPIKVHAST